MSQQNTAERYEGKPARAMVVLKGYIERVIERPDVPESAKDIWRGLAAVIPAADR